MHNRSYASPRHCLGPSQNGLDGFQQCAVPVVFQNARTAFDEVILAVIRRVVRQFEHQLVPIGELDQTFMNCVRELAISGPLSRSINSRRTPGSRPAVGPPQFQTIRHEVAGVPGSPEDHIQLTAVDLQNTGRREHSVGVHVMVGSTHGLSGRGSRRHAKTRRSSPWPWYRVRCGAFPGLARLRRGLAAGGRRWRRFREVFLRLGLLHPSQSIAQAVQDVVMVRSAGTRRPSPAGVGQRSLCAPLSRYPRNANGVWNFGSAWLVGIDQRMDLLRQLRLLLFAPGPSTSREIVQATNPGAEFVQSGIDRVPPPTKNPARPTRITLAIIDRRLRLKLPPPKSRQLPRRRLIVSRTDSVNSVNIVSSLRHRICCIFTLVKGFFHQNSASQR